MERSKRLHSYGSYSDKSGGFNLTGEFSLYEKDGVEFIGGNMGSWGGSVDIVCNKISDGVLK